MRCSISVFFIFTFFLRSLSENLDHLTLGKATSAARAALPSPTRACRVLSCFRNPPNSDMDYRGLVVFLYACMYTQGLDTPPTSQHNIFDSEKNLTNLSCAPDGVRTSGLWISSPMLYQFSHPVTPGSSFSSSSSYFIIINFYYWNLFKYCV